MHGHLMPDARQCPTRSPIAPIACLRGCELGYSEIEVADCLALRETVSRWWTAYVDHGLEARPGDRTGRPVGSGRTLNDGQRRLRTILNEKAPRRWDRLPVVDPQAVAELIRRRRDRLPGDVGEYLERWGSCRGAAPSCQGSGPRGESAWLEVTYPAISAAAREERRSWCDETGAAADQHRDGVRPRGAAGEDRGARSPHPHELISTISTRDGPLTDRKETRRRTVYVLERMLSETTQRSS